MTAFSNVFQIVIFFNNISVF